MSFDYYSFTGRNIGFIDEREQQLLRQARVFVFGVGGMGGAAFMALARAGVGKFVIADIDRFEVSNLNRQVFAFADEVGREKATVAAEAAKAAIASARYRLLILNALEWIEDGAWLKLRPALRQQRIKPFAAALMHRRIAKTRKRAKEISKLSVHDRHKLRIAMKKVRYSIYFFESLFDGHACQKALSSHKRCLGSLQDSLGALNDIAVHQRMVTRLRTDIENRKSEPVAFAAGAVVGTERSETEKLLAAAEKAAHKLRRAKNFWR